MALLVLALIMAGCTTGEGSDDSEDGTSAQMLEGGGELTDPTISTEDLREAARSSLEGATVGWLPVTLGYPITDNWTARLEGYAEEYGFELVTRDPNFDPNRMVQAAESFAAELEPGDVLVVHNLDPQILAGPIQEAEEKGIYVISLNIISNTKSAVYVGADFFELGRRVGEDIAEACSGSDKSGKVALIDILNTDAASQNSNAGLLPVLEERGIEVVSHQTGNADREQARSITATVLQQHPDLCAVWGLDPTMTLGAGVAVQAAGTDTLVYTGDNSQNVCDGIADGTLDVSYGYGSSEMVDSVVTVASFLVQSELDPSALNRSWIFSLISRLDETNADAPGACYSG